MCFRAPHAAKVQMYMLWMFLSIWTIMVYWIPPLTPRVIMIKRMLVRAFFQKWPLFVFFLWLFCLFNWSQVPRIIKNPQIHKQELYIDRLFINYSVISILIQLHWFWDTYACIMFPASACSLVLFLHALFSSQQCSGLDVMVVLKAGAELEKQCRAEKWIFYWPGIS